MAATYIHPDRVNTLNDRPTGTGTYVLYWMQRAQRVRDNHALAFAINEANRLKLPLLAVFALTPSYPLAAAAHYRFMLEGIVETAADLRALGAAFTVVTGNPPEAVSPFLPDAAATVCDAAYLRHLREWRKDVGAQAHAACYIVETDLVVPVAAATTKREYAARTLRPRIHRVLEQYLDLPEPRSLTVPPRGILLPSSALKAESVESLLEAVRTGNASENDDANRQAGLPSPRASLSGGASAARRRFDAFVEHDLPHYARERNDPGQSLTSGMSAYLHFGHISPLRLLHQVTDAGQRGGEWQEGADAFTEELVIRRELGYNYVYFTPNYDSYDALPEWTRKTLDDHASDEREWVYSKEELVAAETHDRYWNAAMKELLLTGSMHGYMRMYWGKKVLEWSVTPRVAYETLLDLNNRYFIDGRDANSYANVGWIFGLHDRPWTERAMYGKVRSMTSGGLERKFNMNAYLERVEALKS